MNPTESKATGTAGGGNMAASGLAPVGGAMDEKVVGNAVNSGANAEKGKDVPNPAVDDVMANAPYNPISHLPGSIGSASSGPAFGSGTNLAAALTPTDNNVAGGNASNANAGGASAGGVNTVAPVAAPAQENSNLLTQAANETPAIQTPYNPFAMLEPEMPKVAEDIAQEKPEQVGMQAGMTQANPGMAQANPGVAQANPGVAQMNPGATQANPSGVQAGVMQQNNTPEKKEKKVNALTIVFAVISAVCLVLAIVFFIMWFNLKCNPEIRYLSTPNEGAVVEPGVGDEVVKVCGKVDTNISTETGLITATEDLVLSFADESWTKFELDETDTYIDEAFATSALNDRFAAMVAIANLTSSDGQIVSTGAAVQDGNKVEFKQEMDMKKLTADLAGAFDVPKNDAGDVILNQSDVEAFYSAKGYTCE